MRPPYSPLLTRRTFGLSLGAAALSACTSRTPPPSSRERLIVSINNTSVSSPACQMIARDRGYFEEEGLEVEFLTQENQSLVVGAVLSGDADIASAGVNAAVLNAASHGDLVIVASTIAEKAGFHNAAFFTSVANYEAGLRSARDFAGRGVGGTVPGNGFHYSLLLAGRKYGYRGEDCFRMLGNVGNLVAAVKSGSLDAGIYTGPVALNLEATGEGKMIGWAADVGDFMTSGVYVTRKALERRRSAIARFLRANFRATQDYDRAFQLSRDSAGRFAPSPLAGELVEILSKNVGISKSDVERSLPYIRPSGDVDMASLRDQIATWQSLRLVDEGIKAEQIVDSSFLEGASPGGSGLPATRLR